MMQPQLAASIEKSTRKQISGGNRTHGTDALRFTLAALAAPSRDIRFDLGRVAGYATSAQVVECSALCRHVGGRHRDNGYGPG